MVNNLEEIAEMSGSCSYNILRNIIEKPHNEVLGDLIGKKLLTKKNGERHILVNAYPLVTAKTSKIYANHGNLSARKRLRLLDEIGKLDGISKFHVNGNYHSHVYGVNEELVSFSEYDINFFRDEMILLNLEYSIQILAHVRIIDLEFPNGGIIKKYNRQMRFIFEDN